MKARATFGPAVFQSSARALDQHSSSHDIASRKKDGNKAVELKDRVAGIMSQPQSLFGQGTLPEENVRALDQLRQRLQQMSHSLSILKADLTKTESLPTW
jgi:hypothetical protein